MAKAFVCDMTGKVCEGESVKIITVDLSLRLRLAITPLQQIAPNRYAEADLSPAAAEKIEKALAPLRSRELLTPVEPAKKD